MRIDEVDQLIKHRYLGSPDIKRIKEVKKRINSLVGDLCRTTSILDYYGGETMHYLQWFAEETSIKSVIGEMQDIYVYCDSTVNPDIWRSAKRDKRTYWELIEQPEKCFMHHRSIVL